MTDTSIFFVDHHERFTHMKNCQMEGENENMIVT